MAGQGVGHLIIEKDRLKLIYVQQKLAFDKFQCMPNSLKNNIRIRIIIFTIQHKLQQLDDRIEAIDRQIQQIHGQQAG